MTQATRRRIVILSAPSGCGKSTIIARLLQMPDLHLEFSVSSTSRPPREGEVQDVHYHFLTPEEFRRRIERGMFLEYEEVYPGRYYGTQLSEVDRVAAHGNTLIMDIDVCGAGNVKERLGDDVLTIFIEPPSLEVLQQRLTRRGTDSAADIHQRLSKAALEMSYAPAFDCRVVNDDLDEAVDSVASLIRRFIS